MLRIVDELLCECMPLFLWEIKYSDAVMKPVGSTCCHIKNKPVAGPGGTLQVGEGPGRMLLPHGWALGPPCQHQRLQAPGSWRQEGHRAAKPAPDL